MTNPSVPDPEESTRDRTQVLVVEDEASTRRLLRAVLDSTSTFEVVGEAETGRQALEDSRRLRPDVILLDLALPDGDAAQILPQLLEFAPRAKVVVLSRSAGLAGPGLVDRGATAYIEKGLPPRELLAALAAAIRERPAPLDKQPERSEVPVALPPPAGDEVPLVLPAIGHGLTPTTAP
jgi:DNA-binding NarL/FixJ family response regulator